MSRMTLLADSIVNSQAAYRADDDLPYPNIYFATVFAEGRNPAHVYICADFTGAAIRKVSNWMVEHHRFRPMRSNSVVKMRRLKLGDLVQNPAAFDSALRLAQHHGESDIVAALLKLPDWVSQRVGVPVPEPIDAKGLWDKLSESIERLERAAGAKV